MSHEITDTDRAVFYKKSAWHKLGIVIEESMSPMDAARKFGLDFDILSRPIQTVPVPSIDGMPEVEPMTVPGRFAQVRSDNNVPLDIVSGRYETIQNMEVCDLAERIGQETGAKVESMFSIKGGREFCLLLQIGSWVLGKDDPSVAYAFLHTGHVGNIPLTLRSTRVRVVCDNTKRMAMAGSKAAFTFRHTRNVRNRIDLAVAEIQSLQDSIAQEKEIESTLAGIDIDFAWAKKLTREFSALLVPADKKDDSKLAKKIRDGRRERAEGKILENFIGEVSQTEAAWETGYGLSEAMGQFVQHDRFIRGGDVDPTLRVRAALLDNTQEAMKEKARELVLAVRG